MYFLDIIQNVHVATIITKNPGGFTVVMLPGGVRNHGELKFVTIKIFVMDDENVYLELLGFQKNKLGYCSGTAGGSVILQTLG